MKRIYITGKPAVGKTTIASKIQEALNIPVYHSDFVLFKHLGGTKKRRRVTESELRDTLDKILSRNSWIYEGKHLIPDLIKNATVVLYVKEPLNTILFRQWKRYFTDKTQRELHGFKNNLVLSKNIIKMYLSKENINQFDNFWYFHEDKLIKIAKMHKVKILEVTPSNRITTESILRNLVKETLPYE